MSHDSTNPNEQKTKRISVGIKLKKLYAGAIEEVFEIWVALRESREELDRWKKWKKKRTLAKRQNVDVDLDSLATPDERRIEKIEAAIEFGEYVLLFFASLKAFPAVWFLTASFFGFAPMRASSFGFFDAIGVGAIIIYFAVFRFSAYLTASRFLPNAINRNFDTRELNQLRFLQIRMPKTYLESGYALLHGDHGAAVVSRRVCLALIQGQDMPIHFRGEFEASHPQIFHLKRIAVGQAILQQKSIYNDALCRLGSDLVFQHGKLSSPALVQKTDYLTLMATNYMALKHITQVTPLRTGFASLLVHDGSELFLTRVSAGDQTKILRPLGADCDGIIPAAAANVIGVSMLAITDDRLVFLTEQTVGSMQSGGLVAPSGSGSVDFADFLNLGENPTILQLASYAARREMLEEGGLMSDGLPLMSREMPIGFARMLHVGGKPEFFFLGRIDATMSEVRKRREHSRREEMFTRSNFPLSTQLQVSDIISLRQSWSELKSEMRHVIQARFSMPLTIMEECLDAALSDDECAEKVRQFIAK